jgi:hypothetical protein
MTISDVLFLTNGTLQILVGASTKFLENVQFQEI